MRTLPDCVRAREKSNQMEVPCIEYQNRGMCVKESNSPGECKEINTIKILLISE